MNETAYPQDAWKLLSGRLTPKRSKKMEEVASQRTKHLRLIIQDVHNPHNISACIRSAEAFGIQNVHVVALKNSFKTSTVARGAGNWLSIHRHESIEECANTLHKLGYSIAAGMPTQSSSPLHSMELSKPVAVLFGNEHEGVSPDWKKFIDLYFTIPMVGVVESLNISVSAAITMQHLSHRARLELSEDEYLLNPEEQNQLLCNWVCSQIPSWETECKVYRDRLANSQ
ncbi:MAG: RNA methyltransferase [Oligoflexales bacterium]|nr:RNA methyltransferase [Oligoflexales bacterium]